MVVVTNIYVISALSFSLYVYIFVHIKIYTYISMSPSLSAPRPLVFPLSSTPKYFRSHVSLQRDYTVRNPVVDLSYRICVTRACLLCLPQSSRIHISTTDKDAVVSLNVRPWFHVVADLESLAFDTDTPAERQQLFLGGRRLQDDGRVLAHHGVAAGATIQLVSARKCVIKLVCRSLVRFTNRRFIPQSAYVSE